MHDLTEALCTHVVVVRAQNLTPHAVEVRVEELLLTNMAFESLDAEWVRRRVIGSIHVVPTPVGSLQHGFRHLFRVQHLSVERSKTAVLGSVACKRRC